MTDFSPASLTPAPTAEVPTFTAPLTVSEVNNRARLLLEKTLGLVTVTGEISNFKVVSGHSYFVLKDAQSQLNAALFKREALSLRFPLRDGMEVVATGKLTVYAAYGRYQMVVDRVEPKGVGNLQAAFEQLKTRLANEGLFAASRKRSLPLLPRRVAVVTSPTGAVIRDIVNVATRRFPNAQILVVPTRVQGAECAASVVAAIDQVAQRAAVDKIDVLIVARGGGSLEDLWGFNDEQVARAIAACPIPVVSAVGHETDFTIADFVADCRAPTPSAAAELVFPLKSDMVARLLQPVERAQHALRRDLQRQRFRLRACLAELGDGRTMLREHAQRLADLGFRREKSLRQIFLRRRQQMRHYETLLAAAHPKVRLHKLRSSVEASKGRIVLLMKQRLPTARRQMASLEARLQALSPLGVLQRGYGIVLRQDGQAVRRASEVACGERVEIRVAEGILGARVEEVRSGNDG